MNEDPTAQTAAPAWFHTPGRPFEVATFWFWHRLPTGEEIHTQLADMKAKGIGMVMIQARPALERTLYLSPPYLEACRAACAQARRLGLGITLYDEYGWMSGHGGGRTVEGGEHLRERHLFWATGAAEASELMVSGIRAPFFDFMGQMGRDWLYEGGVARWGDWRSILVIAHPASVTTPDDIRPLDGAVIEETGPDSCRIRLAPGVSIPEGWRVTAFVSARCLTSRLVNYLLPETAQRFAEAVYGPLLAAAGGQADSVFFDHPYAGFYLWNEHHGPLGNSLLSDGTSADPADARALLSLTCDVGPESARLRAGYLRRYGQRMHEAFFGTLSRWAREHHIGLTGHELLTHVGSWNLQGDLRGFDPRSMPGIDYFGIDAYRTETTVDAADYAPQLAARFGDSVARAHGRTRCTIEQYATGREVGLPALAGQWGLTPARFRAQSIRHLLFGARRILLHAVNVTDGFDDDPRPLANPRFDFPPAFNFEPWWEDCHLIFRELARLSAFLEEGEPVRPVALFYPLQTLYAEGPDHACGAHFGRWAQALARAGIGYDIVDEATLAPALGHETRYATLILPAVTLFGTDETAEIIAAFARRGGHVVLSQTAADARVSEGILPDLTASEPVTRLVDPSVKTITAWVGQLERPVPDVRFADGGTTWCTALHCGDEWRLAVFNDMAQARDLSIAFAAETLEGDIWCPRTGERRALPASAFDGRHFRGTLAPEGILCLSIRAAAPPVAAPREMTTKPAHATEPLASLTLSEGWTLEADGRPPVPIAVDGGWEGQGFDTFAGTGIYRCTVRLPRMAMARWQIRLPAVHESAELWIDGAWVGTHIAGEACFPLPAVSGADCLIELRVRNTAANRYYAGSAFGARPSPSGLTQPPRLEALSSSD
ncbi:carbohydrate-binding protein [Ancylobacter amanitiformis]|uniref:Uncharacterized protein n=1 Tax=Ancylobacter amanitiformis TaxID=217069 RepID=A0ABU0LKD4_9HYPH|nr:carbohydrate-binding protein [Ancylobacter amanitiformis]MDQ0509154.1 hypothetical protein [Ancylobacter amanitiformis]